ncbi:MAG TPA: hypothetical protein VD970_17000 [Acetobacteraceae bacterium]|nr:hypothetical protein [Acetobacteraceae bacterium]
MLVGDLSSWRLPADSALRRAPPRPPAQRQPDYLERFDALTLLADVFEAPDGASAMAIAPPPLNLEPALRAARYASQGVLREVAFTPMHLVWRLVSQGARAGDVVEVSGALGEAALRVTANLGGLFAGRRVLVTLSKDNKLPWITDWLRFHVLEHGADAALIYDNGSTAYDLAALDEAVSGVAGLRAAVVVPWPFRYGPGAHNGSAWDSNYCKMTFYEHARWRFLWAARSVLNCDVDELVLTEDRRGVFEMTEGSAAGYLAFPGVWIENVGEAGAGASLPRFTDFRVRLREADSPPKWCVVPGRLPDAARWATHRIEGAREDGAADGVLFRHFRAISTGWKYPRGAPVAFDAARHVVDEPLRAALGRVFPPRREG